MTKDEALKMALKYIEQNRGENRLEWGDIMLAIRRALAEPDMGIDRGAWDDVPDATKWVDELRGDDEQPEREWQGLTDEERRGIPEWQKIQEELGSVWSPMMLYLYIAIEAKLKEKNYDHGSRDQS